MDIEFGTFCGALYTDLDTGLISLGYVSSIEAAGFWRWSIG
jgi:hypothetical protein